MKTDRDAETLMKYPGAIEAKENGPRAVRLKVQNSDEELPKIIQYISGNSLSITRLTVQKPTLDDVFLEYTGNEIRSEEPTDSRQEMMNLRRLRR
jgi:ABC-2 type transport system ATP-binding protein